jgi:hypothetical protein
MSIEDINFMKANSIKQAYTFIIDSSERDRNMYPNPNNYVVNFSTPFKNIIGLEIIDASIPRAMYTIDIDNNDFVYYVGNDTDDEIITNGIKINNSANLILKANAKIIGDELKISNGYAILSNSINIYNIYNNENTIGGNTIGITFNIILRPIILNNDVSFNIINFSYNHVYFANETSPNNKYNHISIDIKKSTSTYILSFIIGTTIKDIVIPYTSDYINLYWSISDTIWSIYIVDKNNNIIKNESFNDDLTNIKDKIYNVFYTKKYIGKKYDFDSGNWIGEWSGVNELLLKEFKIYNTSVIYNNDIDIMFPIDTMPVWYKMNLEVNKEVINIGNNKEINYKDIFKKITITPGDYNFKTFITKFNELNSKNNLDLFFSETTDPSSLTNLIDIYSKSPFIIDMKRSTLSENLGFDLYPSMNNDNRYLYKRSYIADENLIKMFESRVRNVNDKYYNKVPHENYKYIITSPGIVYFIGNKYIIMRCPEIEEHLYRSLSYSKNTLGLAKFRVDSIGINSEKLSITKIAVREFHPIGKLSRLSLRFETNKGTLYDFKGINHNIIFAIFYYEPIQKNIPTYSILNPAYKMNYIDYLYKQEEIEADSSDDDNDIHKEDFSRDNIDEYKIKENLYNERGIKLQQFKNYYQNNDQNEVIDNEDNEEDNDEDNEEDNDEDNEEDNDEDNEDNEYY